MNDSFKKREKAFEDDYFQRKEREAIERMSKHKETKRISPVSGQPMVEKSLHGIIVDQCPVTGGIWLDAGELEQIVELSKQDQKAGGLEKLFSGLLSGFKIQK